ncbi:MAG: acyl-CoA dehydrogenase family protein [Sphingorhabdus sp.]
MNFEPNENQQALIEALDIALGRSAGWERGLHVASQGGYDKALASELLEGGFTGAALEEGLGLVEASLIVERVARHIGQVPMATSAIVIPALTGEVPPDVVAIASKSEVGGAIRYAPQAERLLFDRSDGVYAVELGAHAVELLDSDATGYPLGRVSLKAIEQGKRLDGVSALRFRSLRQLALAAEAVGLMEGALELTSGYVKDRVQFNRPIGSFQTVQHRLAHCKVKLEGARWLARKAAFDNAAPASAAMAAAQAITAARLISQETHQLHGAIGFTREYPLHLWTMRLEFLQREMAGVAGHRRAVFEHVSRSNAERLPSDGPCERFAPNFVSEDCCTCGHSIAVHTQNHRY